jgi:hypothetical protein
MSQADLAALIALCAALAQTVSYGVWRPAFDSPRQYRGME